MVFVIHMQTTRPGLIAVPWVREAEETRDKSLFEKQGVGKTAIGWGLSEGIQLRLSVLLYCSQAKINADPCAIRVTAGPFPDSGSKGKSGPLNDLSGGGCGRFMKEGLGKSVIPV